MMNNLRLLWEVGGMVDDQNGDNVADRVNVSIILDGFQPMGLIDFCARLGFETTSLSFDFLQENNRYKNQMLLFHESETSVQWTSNQLQIRYKSEEEASKILRFLAGKWNKDIIDTDVKITKLILHEDNVALEDENGKIIEYLSLIPNRSYQVRHYSLQSLSDIWSEKGFLHEQEPSPENKHTIQFRLSTNIELSIFQEICYGAARIGMESTSLTFPITGREDYDGLKFQFHMINSANATISLNEDTVIFRGGATALQNAVTYFFREKHWSYGGHFASWEKNIRNQPNEEELLFSMEWHDKGEVADLDEILIEVNKDFPEAEDLIIYLSEPTKHREKIKKRIEKMFPNSNIVIRSAFKPGYFWLTEEILPMLMKHKKQLYKITIKCKQDQKKDGLELPIRWIQELYPVDEVLAKSLGIEVANINFDLDTSLQHTYEVIAYDKQMRIIFQEKIIVPVSKVPYVEEGKYSYPTTGCLFAKYKEKQKSYVIQPDRERFYLFYLEKVLPKLWSNIKTKEPDSGFTKPLFDRIEIHVQMSEEECSIPVEEERISPLEALHEDLYFNTLDYFIVKGKEHIGKGYTAPGGVYPFLKVTPYGQPKAHIKAFKWCEYINERIWTNQLVFTSNKNVPVQFRYITKHDTQQHVKIISDDWQTEKAPIDLPKPRKAPYYSWLCDYSYRGKPIYVYEFINPVKEEYYSAIKLSTYKPTVLIETGHHANEVSSMPAIVELMDDIFDNHIDILKNINLVIIPRANPDGTELHQKMVKDNPEWKHHAARYNAVGLEYSDVRYLDTIFGEANVVPKIMNKWAPDIVIDDHGIPSHEWTQPYAGYHIPPRFKMSFWIPNALIYGIAKKLDEKLYPEHEKILQHIIRKIEQKIKDTTIQNKNVYWMERYKKYGHQFLPEYFPIELANKFIFYRWLTKPDNSSHHAISRFPDWVSADLISEAADETVYGDALEVCKLAHRLFDLAAIEWINRENQIIHKKMNETEIRITRKRPLKIV